MNFSMAEVFLILSVFIETSTSDVDEKLSEFCSRDRNIVAASKSPVNGQFYLYEEEHAWVFDFREQKIVQFIPDEYVKERLEGEKILRATGGYKCDQADQLQFKEGRMVSTAKIYEFGVMENSSTWKWENAKTRHDAVTKNYGMEVDNFKVEDLVTVGSTYFYESKGACPIRTQFHFLPNKIRLCKKPYPNKQGSCESRDGDQNIGVYHPDTYELIRSLSKLPDALAFDHGVSKTELRAVFVSEHVLYSWSQEGGIKEISIRSLFKCSSLLTVVLIIVGVVVLLVILGAVALLVVVALRKRSDFEEGGTMTVAATQTVVKRGGKKP